MQTSMHLATMDCFIILLLYIEYKNMKRNTACKGNKEEWIVLWTNMKKKIKKKKKQIAAHSATLLGYVDRSVEDAPPACGAIHGGINAARATMDLLLRTYRKIDPLDLTDTFVSGGGSDAVWKKYFFSCSCFSSCFRFFIYSSFSCFYVSCVFMFRVFSHS